MMGIFMVILDFVLLNTKFFGSFFSISYLISYLYFHKKIEPLFYLLLFLFGVIINNNLSITFLIFIIIFSFSNILRKKVTGNIGNFLLFFLFFYLIYYLCYYLFLFLFEFIDFKITFLIFQMLNDILPSVTFAIIYFAFNFNKSKFSFSFGSIK